MVTKRNGNPTNQEGVQSNMKDCFALFNHQSHKYERLSPLRSYPREECSNAGGCRLNENTSNLDDWSHEEKNDGAFHGRVNPEPQSNLSDCVRDRLSQRS